MPCLGDHFPEELPIQWVRKAHTTRWKAIRDLSGKIFHEKTCNGLVHSKWFSGQLLVLVAVSTARTEGQKGVGNKKKIGGGGGEVGSGALPCGKTGTW